ncbi:hypothetical protein [Microbacterium lacticum]
MGDEKLVKSRQRVADHGEVFTPRWLVDDMLDLVKGETERIDSRFLEPRLCASRVSHETSSRSRWTLSAWPRRHHLGRPRPTSSAGSGTVGGQDAEFD